MGVKTAIMTGGIALALTAGPASAADTLKIGFVTTLSTGGAVIGEEVKKGWDLGMESVGGKIGGLTTDVTVLDDEAKPETAVTGVDKLINDKKVDVIAGVVWANIMIAIYDQIVKSHTALMVTNSGPNIAAGKDCSPYFISTSWESDQFSSATAAMAHADGLKNAYIIAPNYQIGKDISAIFRSEFKGGIVGETLFKLNQTDYQAELSEIRAAHPDGVIAFAPGAMAIAMMKQWQALGMSKITRLYTINMIDELTLPVLGEAVMGSYFVSVYDATLDTPANKAFVEAFKKKYGRLPTQYSAQTYDGVRMLDAAIRALDGKIDDRKALIAEMRKAKFESVRGPLRYNNNNFPIDNMYKIQVAAGPDGKPMLKGAGIAVKDSEDPYHGQCSMTW